MRVIEIRQRFGLEQLALARRPRPEAAAGQVLLRMRAASLNFRDLLMIQGRYDPRQPLPLVPCSDGVGERFPGVDYGLQIRRESAGCCVKCAAFCAARVRNLGFPRRSLG